MLGKRLAGFKVLFTLVVFSWGWAAYGNDIVRSKEELETLQKNIALLKRNIVKNRKQVSEQEAELTRIERRMSEMQTQKRELKANQLENQKIYDQAQQEIERLQQQQQQLQRQFQEMIRVRYLLQDQNIIKLILNQQETDALSRAIVYYQHVAEQSDALLRDLEASQQLLTKKTTALKKQGQRLEADISQLAALEADIESQASLRKETLAEVKDELAAQTKKADHYSARESELQLLLRTLYERKALEARKAKAREAELRRQQQQQQQQQQVKVVTQDSNTTDTLNNADEPVKPKPQTQVRLGQFGDQKGRLKMPVRGQLVSKFGDISADSGQKLNGVMVSTQSGEQVTSVYDGQVVYADWFRGYGQLLVIDHGSGYMSLYGHNQSLSVAVGEVVTAGQEIARAGVTGGLSDPGLYFEIRVQGEPSDPLQWCVI